MSGARTDMHVDLEARVRRIEDREAIRRLVSLYTLAMDDRDMDLAARIFARDAVLTYPGGSPLFRGRDAIVAFYRERLAPTGPSFHFTHDQIVEWDDGDPDRATGLVACHAETSGGGRQFISAIRYEDVYVREDGEWRFSRRTLTFLYQTPVEHYVSILARKDRLRLTEPARLAHWPVSRQTNELL